MECLISRSRAWVPMLCAVCAVQGSVCGVCYIPLFSVLSYALCFTTCVLLSLCSVFCTTPFVMVCVLCTVSCTTANASSYLTAISFPPTSPRHAGTLAASRLAYLPICSSICMTADSAVRAPEKVTTTKVAESSSPCDIFFFFWPAPLYSKAFLDLERCMGQYSLSHFPFSSFFLFCPSDCVLLAGYRPDLNLPCFALPCLALLHYLLLFIVFSSRLVRHARLALY